MAIAKTCDVCGAAGAETITVAINAVSASGSPVGTSQGKDLCDAHRVSETAAMFAQCQTDIEAAIAA